jgi:hypothetical protein
MKKFAFSIFIFMFVIPFLSIAQTPDDLFKVQTPNVMVIFDTSSSMEMSMNIDKYGNSIWTTKYGPDKVTPYRLDGSHPDSKLYQAKDALSQIINEVVKNKVNLGFSTYAQQKIDQTRGQYKRDEKVITQYAQNEAWFLYKRYYIWSTTNDSTRTATSIYNNSFVDAWGNTRPVDPVNPTNTTFTRAIWIHDKSGPLHPQVCGGGPQCVGYYGYFLATKPYTITYKVTVAPSLNPENGVYTYTYAPTSAAYDWYGEYTFTKTYTSSKDCGSDKKNNPWEATQSGGWVTHFSNDSPATEYNSPSNGRTANWWKCSTGYQPKKDEISHTETKYYWLSASGASCPNTQVGPPVLNYVPGTCFDWSAYKYTPEGTHQKPDTWSYFFIHQGNNDWMWNQQRSPYYPAGSGNPGENDHHYFFIDFPDDKASGFKDSDRTTIMNNVLSFLDLTPVKRPDYPEYWTKLPIHAIQGKQGLTGNIDPYLGQSAFNPQHVTPLADSLYAAYNYFYDYINNYNGGDPASKQQSGDTFCRGNYIIFLTDGLESCKLDKNGNPDYTAAPQQAANLLGINVKTFVIGFGGDINGNQSLNNIAAAGGTCRDPKTGNCAYFAANFKDLKKALQSIFQTISGQYYGRSNPVITRDRSRLYKGSFDIEDGDWLGHLMAWDADKHTGVLAPDFVWDSGERITTNGRGTVYTWTDTGLNPTVVGFTATGSSLYPLVNPLNEDVNNDGKSNNPDAVGVIKLTAEPDYNDCDDNIVDKVTLACHGPGYYKGQRAINVNVSGSVYPSWKLGDIYHSTPVVIAEPAFFFTDNYYATFYNNNKNRETMIYVGTNDGMLHAIKNADGTEKFAIIPKNLLGKLKDLRSTHGFYVDSSPKAYDVYFKGESKWKTVLISGERGGGPYYFAIDVTDPNNPKILWEWTDTNIGETWAKPEIGMVKVGSDTKFAAFFTGGYSTADNQGNSFYIVDIETGTTLKMWTKSNGNPVGSKTNKIPAGATAFDVNQDGFIEYVYFGDIQGTLWKVDIGSTDINDWTLYNFFAPTKDPKPIFYSPAIVKNDEGQILIFMGTGNELGLTTLDANYFYEIQDQGTTGKQNWERDLEVGEKVLASPTVANYVVYFTTWVNTASAQFCGAGEGRLYGLKISNTGQNGGDAGLITLDPNTGKWVTKAQDYMSLGAGIPSAPLVTNGMIYIGTSINANKVIQIPIPGWAIAKTKSWREIVR